jgi:hypothetical protein
MNYDANSKSRLKTTEYNYNYIVCFNRLWLLARKFISGRVIGKTDIPKVERR